MVALLYLNSSEIAMPANRNRVCLCIVILLLFGRVAIPTAAQQTSTDLTQLDIDTLTQQANAGDPDAEYEMGCRYGDGNKGVSQDRAQAFNWYIKAANQGHIKAETLVGYYYDNGIGTGKDPQLAAQWYQKAADNGSQGAELYLGEMYQNGDGVSQDLNQARQWYQKAADQGNANAIDQLAKMDAQPTPASEPAQGNSYAQGLEGQSGEQLLAIIQGGPSAVRAVAPSSMESSEKREIKADVDKCNGGEGKGYIWGANGGSEACQQLSGMLDGDSKFNALLLGCGWDATESFNGGNCSSLASVLIGVGNVAAAKVILSRAPGCHSHDQAGNPVNICFAYALQEQVLFQGDELKNIALAAYAQESDLKASRYLVSIGINADVAAAEASEQEKKLERQQANDAQSAADDAAAAQKQADINNRIATLSQDANQVTANGGLIQQTTNQQNTSSGAPAASTSNGDTACRNMNACIQIVSSSWERAAGQPIGFVHVVVRNNCNQRIRITTSVYAQNESCVLSQSNNFNPGDSEDMGQSSDRGWYSVQADDNVTSGMLGNSCRLVIANSCPQ